MIRLHPDDDLPQGVSVPEVYQGAPPLEAPPEIARFFGKTGGWWGTWKSPQTKGSYDVILVVREIYLNGDGWEAKVTYGSADYPKWYIQGGTWEIVGNFTKKRDGTLALWVKHPMAGVMEFWFEGRTLRGKLSMRFMLCRTTLKPLR